MRELLEEDRVDDLDRSRYDYRGDAERFIRLDVAIGRIGIGSSSADGFSRCLIRSSGRCDYRVVRY